MISEETFEFQLDARTVLPHTGTQLVPDYFCLIPEQSRPQRGTSRVSLLAAPFQNNCFIPE